VKNRDIFENKCIMDKITMDFQKQRFLDLSWMGKVDLIWIRVSDAETDCVKKLCIIYVTNWDGSKRNRKWYNWQRSLLSQILMESNWISQWVTV
jgi:hypothetical protein